MNVLAELQTISKAVDYGRGTDEKGGLYSFVFARLLHHQAQRTEMLLPKFIRQKSSRRYQTVMRVRFMLLSVVDCYENYQVQQMLQAGWRVGK